MRGGKPPATEKLDVIQKRNTRGRKSAATLHRRKFFVLLYCRTIRKRVEKRALTIFFLCLEESLYTNTTAVLNTEKKSERRG